MSRRKLLHVIPLLLLLALAATPAFAQVNATAVNVEVTTAGDTADAKFSVAVNNGGSAALQNVWVVFEDGQELLVGDVAAGGTTTSTAVTRTLTLLPTASQPVKVTLKYTVDGEAAEASATLIVRVQ